MMNSLGLKVSPTSPGHWRWVTKELEKTLSFSLIMPDSLVFSFRVQQMVNVHYDDAGCEDAHAHAHADLLLTQGGVWLSHSVCAETAAPTV